MLDLEHCYVDDDGRGHCLQCIHFKVICVWGISAIGGNINNINNNFNDDNNSIDNNDETVVIGPDPKITTKLKTMLIILILTILIILIKIILIINPIQTKIAILNEKNDNINNTNKLEIEDSDLER